MTAQDDDLPPEAANSQHLATAFWGVHADPQLLRQYRQKTEQLEREGRWQYVGRVRNPEGSVLSEFDSHGQELLREQREIVARIEEGYMTKLRCGALAAWAREGSPLAPWRMITASAWRTLKLGDVMKGTATGPGVSLFDIRVGVPVAPRTPEPILVPPLPTTGAPGRPSHMHLVITDFERRVQAGQLEKSLAREAATLAAWFKANHPGRQPRTAKAVENRIRMNPLFLKDLATRHGGCPGPRRGGLLGRRALLRLDVTRGQAADGTVATGAQDQRGRAGGRPPDLPQFASGISPEAIAPRKIQYPVTRRAAVEAGGERDPAGDPEQHSAEGRSGSCSICAAVSVHDGGE